MKVSYTVNNIQMFLLGALMVLGFQETVSYFLPMINDKGLFYYLCVYLTTGFILGRVTKSHAEFYSKLEEGGLESDITKRRSTSIKSNNVKTDTTSTNATRRNVQAPT